MVVYYTAENSSALTLTGSSLGPPALPPPGTPSPYYVIVTYTDDSSQTIPSNDARVHVWTADTITLRLDQPTRRVGAVTVFTPTWSSTVQPQIVNYDLDFFSTDADAPRGGSLPATIVADPLAQVWINSEYHSYLLYFEPLLQAVLHIPTYPMLPVDVYPYTMCLAGGCGRARCSAWGESVVLDTEDRVWFTEGGAEPLMDGDELAVNHARIVAFDIHTQAPKLYNIPGNRNSVMGIAWDAGRRRIWFAQTAHPSGEPAKLISFDPDGIPDQEFDFNWSPDWNPAIDTQCTIPSGAATGTCDNNPNNACLSDDDCILVERLCPPGTTDDSTCYHEYELAPGTYQPAQVAVHPDGAIWYTHYFVASDIGRLIPETGEIFLFRMSPAPNGLATAFPYDIKVAPNGDVTAVGFYSGKLAHIRPEFFANPSCTRLVSPLPDVTCTVDQALMTDPTCYNPCILETMIPGAWASQNLEDITNTLVAFPTCDGLGAPCLREATVPGRLTSENIQWVAKSLSAFLGYDGLGNLWVGPGYYLQEQEFIYMPPIRDLYPSEHCTSTTAPPGIGDSFAFESDGGVWAVDFCGKRLARLRPRPETIWNVRLTSVSGSN